MFPDSALLRGEAVDLRLCGVFTQPLKQELYDTMYMFCFLLFKGFKRYHLKIQWKINTFSSDTGDVLKQYGLALIRDRSNTLVTPLGLRKLFGIPVAWR